MNTDSLEIKALSAGYGKVTVIRDVSFKVKFGEVVGIFGRNGAGKTTLLEAIGGLVESTHGEVKLAGREISGLSPHKIARAGVALVPQWRALFPGMSVIDNLRLACTGLGMHGSHIAQLIEELIEQFPALDKCRTRRAGLLSGGEQQILAIAKALIRNPRMLMLDEPSIGLAPVVVEQVATVIRGLRSSDRAILIAEQRIDWALDAVDRGFVLEGGELVQALAGDRRDQWHQAVESYVGR